LDVLDGFQQWFVFGEINHLRLLCNYPIAWAK
jgi:hypothetical protein